MQKYLVVLVGIIFIAAGGFMYYRNSNLIKNCTQETVATVVDMKEEFSGDSDSTGFMYYPIIEYQADTTPVRVTMSTGSSTPAYSINEKITILYNPNKTNEFIIKGDKSSNIFSIVFMVLGVAVTGYGLVVAFKKN